jgi:LysM repeat protein
MQTFNLIDAAENRRNWRVTDVLIKFGGVVFCAMLVAAVPARAQDVAAAARAERERQQTAQHATHVYTNEDLAAPQILTPEDQDRFASARTVWEPPKGWQLADILPPDVQPVAPPPPPLGDVARSFRLAKDIQKMTVPSYVPTPTYASPVRSNTVNSLTGTGVAPGMPGVSSSAAPVAHGLSVGSVNAPHSAATQHAMPQVISNFGAPAVTAPFAHSAVSGHATHAVPAGVLHSGAAPMISYEAARAFPKALSDGTATLAAPHVAGHFAAPHAVTHSVTHAAAPSILQAAPHAIGHSSLLKPVAPAAPVAPVASASVAPVAHGASVAAGAVTIQPGQTLWHLASEYLGSGYKWHQIAELNPSLGDPTRIAAGTSIAMPAAPQVLSRGAAGAGVAANVAGGYLVQSGDSMWKIAQAQLGNANAWVCVAHANPGIENPNLIFPGQSLTLTGCE